MLVDAIVLDVPESLASERNAARPDRDFGGARRRPAAPRPAAVAAAGCARRASAGCTCCAASTRSTRRDDRPRALVERPPRPDRAVRHHRRRARLRVASCARCSTELGWELELDDDGRAVGARHPEGRTAVFVGDLVDRGPDTPGVLRLVMGMVAAGTALCVSGNHEAKLVRALKGAKVTVVARARGVAGPAGRASPRSSAPRRCAFMDGLISHYVLDGGRLVVAHAGLKEAYHGRASGRVRAFALYGDTTGETDEYGLPVRYPWAQRVPRPRDGRLRPHARCPTAEWVNNTICLDTGVVFGGALTALRYPEREIVSVPAEREWYEPVRPLAPAAGDARARRCSTIDDVGGDPAGSRRRTPARVKIPEENAAAALEVMSRFAVDPRWLVYLPPTMSPAPASTRRRLPGAPGAGVRASTPRPGVDRVVCEEKHMGSRAIAVVARDADDRRAPVRGRATGAPGVVYTRTGRPFFAGDSGATWSTGCVTRARRCSTSLDTDWLVLDCELLPWSAKAMGLIKRAVRLGRRRGPARAAGGARRCWRPRRRRGLDVADLAARTARRTERRRGVPRRRTRRTADRPTGSTVSRSRRSRSWPCEGRALGDRPSRTSWHLDRARRGSTATLITPTRHRVRRPRRLRRRAPSGRRLVARAHRGRRRGDGRQAGRPRRGAACSRA